MLLSVYVVAVWFASIPRVIIIVRIDLVLLNWSQAAIQLNVLLHPLLSHFETLLLQRLQNDIDFAATLTELYWVAQEVYDYLWEPAIIAINRVEVWLIAFFDWQKHQLHILLVSNMPDQSENILDGVIDVEKVLV